MVAVMKTISLISSNLEAKGDFQKTRFLLYMEIGTTKAGNSPVFPLTKEKPEGSQIFKYIFTKFTTETKVNKDKKTII